MGQLSITAIKIDIFFSKSPLITRYCFRTHTFVGTNMTSLEIPSSIKILFCNTGKVFYFNKKQVCGCQNNHTHTCRLTAVRFFFLFSVEDFSEPVRRMTYFHFKIKLLQQFTHQTRVLDIFSKKCMEPFERRLNYTKNQIKK